MFQNSSILSIAPYRFLPPASGGQLCIAFMHHYLGKLCQDQIISTVNNGSDEEYSFQLHKVFPSAVLRYIPFYKLMTISGIAKRYDVNGIICEHPYMALTAMALSRRLKLPWFLRSHNIESERFRSLGKNWWSILRRYECYAMKSADGVFFITPEDAAWAEHHFRLDPKRCHFIPYGTELASAPEKPAGAKQAYAAAKGLDPNKHWLYFLGALNYPPNIEAVQHILDSILPRLQDQGLSIELLIGGKGLPEEIQQKISASNGQIKYLGFIEDLDGFINACDLMLNPVLTGGGIKTKVVEALGYNKTVVSTISGAAGMLPAVCGNKLKITPDHDWNAFTMEITASLDQQSTIPDAFYGIYNWERIAEKILGIMSTVAR